MIKCFTGHLINVNDDKKTLFCDLFCTHILDGDVCEFDSVVVFNSI